MVRFIIILAVTATLFAASLSQAAIRSETVHYKDGDTALAGQVYWDDASSTKRPGILVVHEWWGLNDYAGQRAEMLAALGYVAFAIDMYGDRRVTRHPVQASSWMKEITGNVEHWQRRARLALDILKQRPEVDATQTAAIGYCFGGATVMQMAYADMGLDGIVSFHGSLPVLDPKSTTPLHTRIPVAHGHNDGFVEPEHITAFQTALDKAGADWQMNIYSGARHGFTNPEAGSYGIDGLAYNANADRRSWQSMQDFFNELFHPARQP